MSEQNMRVVNFWTLCHHSLGREKKALLNPSLLQLGCREADDPINDFHVLRPSEVAR